MATIIKLDEYLKRQKELFNAYITSSGQEVSVMPFASSYNQQDNKTYTGDDLLRYIDSYTKGNLITNEELDKYNNTKKMPNDLIFKRGRIIIEAIIASHGDTKNLDRLGRDFAKKDGRLHPYDNKYLLKCRDYYLKNSKNEDLINAYKNVCELVARGTYDIELPLKILEMQDNKKAISFILEDSKELDCIAIITHGGVYRSIFKNILDIDKKIIGLEDLATTSLDYTNEKFTIIDTDGIELEK